MEKFQISIEIKNLKTNKWEIVSFMCNEFHASLFEDGTFKTKTIQTDEKKF